MTMSDPLGDMLTRINNGQRAGKKVIYSHKSKLQSNVLDLLVREGYIRAHSVEADDRGIDMSRIELKYMDDLPVIQEMRRVSKPGRRIYKKVADMPRVKNGLGTVIVSTPQGVMSDSDARAANVGGEVLCTVY